LVEFEKKSEVPRLTFLGLAFLVALSALVWFLQFSGEPVNHEEQASVRRELDPAMKRQLEQDQKLRAQREVNLVKIREAKEKALKQKAEQEAWAKDALGTKQAFFNKAHAEFGEKASLLQDRLVKKGEDIIQNSGSTDTQVDIDALLEEMDDLHSRMDSVKDLSDDGKTDEARVLLEKVLAQYAPFKLKAERFLLEH
jgi:isoleucyl-tRNA synthetase